MVFWKFSKILGYAKNVKIWILRLKITSYPKTDDFTRSQWHISDIVRKLWRCFHRKIADIRWKIKIFERFFFKDLAAAYSYRLSWEITYFCAKFQRLTPNSFRVYEGHTHRHTDVQKLRDIYIRSIDLGLLSVDTNFCAIFYRLIFFLFVLIESHSSNYSKFRF